jgi:hypothetical protein
VVLSEPPDPATLPMFERSPLAVFALDVATFSAYSLYYAIRGRRLAERRLDLYQLTSYWSALWLLLPLVNVVVFVGMFNALDRRTRASGVQPRVPLGVLAFIMVVVAALWRLPDPWSFISTLSSVLFAAIHVPVALAERRDDPARRWAKLHWFEIVILVLGSVLVVLVSLGEFIDTPPVVATWVVTCTWTVLVVTGVVLARMSRALAPRPVAA